MKGPALKCALFFFKGFEDFLYYVFFFPSPVLGTEPTALSILDKRSTVEPNFNPILKNSLGCEVMVDWELASHRNAIVPLQQSCKACSEISQSFTFSYSPLLLAPATFSPSRGAQRWCGVGFRTVWCAYLSSSCTQILCPEDGTHGCSGLQLALLISVRNCSLLPSC